MCEFSAFSMSGPSNFVQSVVWERDGNGTTTCLTRPWWGPFMMNLCLLCVFLDSSAFCIRRTADDIEHFLVSATVSAMSSSIWRRREGAFFIECAWSCLALERSETKRCRVKMEPDLYCRARF